MAPSATLNRCSSVRGLTWWHPTQVRSGSGRFAASLRSQSANHDRAGVQLRNLEFQQPADQRFVGPGDDHLRSPTAFALFEEQDLEVLAGSDHLVRNLLLRR